MFLLVFLMIFEQYNLDWKPNFCLEMCGFKFVINAKKMLISKPNY